LVKKKKLKNPTYPIPPFGQSTKRGFSEEEVIRNTEERQEQNNGAGVKKAQKSQKSQESRINGRKGHINERGPLFQNVCP